MEGRSLGGGERARSLFTMTLVPLLHTLRLIMRSNFRLTFQGMHLDKVRNCSLFTWSCPQLGTNLGVAGKAAPTSSQYLTAIPGRRI
jgi:hypothetical protein